MLLVLAGSAFAQNVQFRQTSVPAGIVNQTATPVWDCGHHHHRARHKQHYKFAYWTINSARFTDPSGYATIPPHLSFNAATDAVANYVTGTQDSDSDGLPDWWELRYFGDLAQGAAGNPDGDAFDNAM